MPIRPIYPESIEPSSTPGDVLTTQDDGTVDWSPPTGGSGGGSAYREVLMASGVSEPAEPLESSDGGDWLYGLV